MFTTTANSAIAISTAINMIKTTSLCNQLADCCHRKQINGSKEHLFPLCLNVYCHNRLLLLYPAGSSKSLYIAQSCTNIPFNVLLAELKQQGGRSGSIQPGFALEERLAGWSVQGTMSYCVKR